MKDLVKSLPLIALFVLSGLYKTTAQDQIPGNYLVCLPSGQTAERLIARLERQMESLYDADPSEITIPAKQKPPFVLGREVSKTLNIWLLQLSRTDKDFLLWLRQQADVLTAQYDHLLTLRSNTLPDDPLFLQQWQYINDGSNGGIPNADLDADLAWDISTGGLSMAGDTIVIAVIDGGVNKSHPDLLRNLWKNNAEKPGDGIDNDLNGYTDDYLGWNVFSQNDNIQGVTAIHGTPVSGVIGASGNNSLGVTGINWNVKIMFVSGGNLESDLLAAYDYILRARSKYNETNGAAGAFVVATNCSWGIDYGMPADAPLWCAAFDKMGQAGIISVAATANNPVNIDVLGDLPTTCPSEFLIAVTSLDRADNLALSAAWGPVNIDLGAYGEGIISTSAGNLYGVHSGTSFAAPQVAGAIGLLYAAPCPELIAEAKIDPESAARLVRQWLLGTTKANSHLTAKTATGGRLNLFKLLKGYQEACADCPTPFALKTGNITANAAWCQWSVTLDFESVSLRWREIGAIDWNIVENLSNAYLLEGLSPCSDYEFSLKSYCSANQSSEWSPPFGFVSNGCCEAPDFAWTLSPETYGANLHWNDEPGFISFKVLIRQQDSSNWQVIQTFDTSLTVSNLNTCVNYECQIQGWCENAWVDLSPRFLFQTLGCGACLDKSYCPASASEAVEEWINSVSIGNWSFESGWGGGGYQNLSSEQLSNPEIIANSPSYVILTPGFWGAPYKEFFRIYIDFNLDGDFDDGGELAFDPGFAQDGVVEGWLNAPEFTTPGTSRMRVMMKYAKENESPPEACSQYSFGQVEDYCVDLLATPTGAKAVPDSSHQLTIYPQPAGDFAWIGLSGLVRGDVELNIWDLSGRKVLYEMRHLERKGAVFIDIANWQAGIYFVSAKYEDQLFRGKLLKR